MVHLEAPPLSDAEEVPVGTGNVASYASRINAICCGSFIAICGGFGIAAKSGEAY